MAAVIICSDFGAQKNKVDTASTVSSYISHEVTGPDAMILVSECWVLNQLFHSPLSLTSRGSLVPLHFLPKAWCHLHIWGYWYSSPILIPVCASSSLVFCMMYIAYKLNKQGDNIEPWRTPFPILNQLIVPGLVLTVASWPAYRFYRRQVRWSGILISLRILYSLLWSWLSFLSINN